MRPIDVLRTRNPTAAHTYLDNLAITPQAAYSVKKLISTATNTMRARNAGGTELDIGFSGYSLDTSTLLGHSGAGSATMPKYYDQVGANHFLQATTASQPRIVNAGVYENRPAFDGSDDFMKAASFPFGAAQCGLYIRGVIQVGAGTGVIVESGAGGPGSVAQALTTLIGAGAPNYIAISSNAAGALRRNDLGVSSNVVRTYAFLFDRSTTGTNEILMYVDGVLQTPTAVNTTDQTGVFSANDLYMAMRSGTSLPLALQPESVVIYNADTSSIRSSIEAVLAA